MDKVKDLSVHFKPEDLIRFERIMVDRDKDEALSFLKEVIKPQVEDKTRTH